VNLDMTSPKANDDGLPDCRTDPERFLKIG
jgi:hypothetical protein